MNSSKDTPLDEHEWEVQERAMRAAHDQREPDSDPAAESYRRVADALRSSPHGQPPADFASAMARHIAQQNAGIERVLFRGLFLTLAASSVIVTALYGGRWWQVLQGVSGDGAPQWVLAGTGCIALSWMINQLRQADLLAGS